MKTVFIRAIEAPVEKKAAAILTATRGPGPTRFEVELAGFKQVPRSPFAYWVSDEVRRAFSELLSVANAGYEAWVGLQTNYDFRWLRLSWESKETRSGGTWIPFAKGGSYSPFYADVHLCARWGEDGRDLKNWKIDQLRLGKITANNSQCWNESHYFRPGLTWPRRTNGLSFRVMPRGCIFADKGPAAFVENNDADALLALCAVANSTAFGALVAVQLARTELAQSFEVGLVQQTPIPDFGSADRSRLAGLARRSWSLKRQLDTRTENSHAFLLPALLQAESETLAAGAEVWVESAQGLQDELDGVKAEVDNHAYRLYGISPVERQRIEQGFRPTGADEEAGIEDDDGSDEEPVDVDAAPMVASLMSWAFGVAVGRFDIRLATGERSAPPEPEPFDPLPVCSPGMLTGEDGLPVETPPSGYPLSFPSDGVLVDDPGHPRDLTRAVRAAFDVVFDDANARWHEAAELLGVQDLRTWFARDYFGQHIKRYSKSRRKAPIYWQLATSSGSYSVWIYIHRATGDTLFRVLNDLVVPKLEHEKTKLNGLKQDAGANPSAAQRRDLDQQETFVTELQALKAEVARVARLWRPDLDDGVILNFAPLWRLVPQNRSWQTECKKAWEKLASGDYDWAHLAMHLWPERVVPNCIDDRSLAIAHGLEDVFWHEDESGSWHKSSVDEATIRKLIAERTSPTVKAALKDLLSAPTPASRGKKKASRAKGARRKSAVSRSSAIHGSSTGRRSSITDEADLLSRVRDAIAAHGDGASKADVIEVTGVSSGQWARAIKTLLADGSVTQTGERRGARYRTAGGNA